MVTPTIAGKSLVKIESGSVNDILSYPSHDYTKKLIYSNSWISE